MKQRVALVDGVADYWGGRVAAQLINDEKWHVLGIDNEPPKVEIKGLDFIQANLHNPLLVELLKQEKVDAVCHLAFTESLRPSEGTFDANVMGTMKLLGACAEAGVRKVVLKSSTMVYGAQPMNSAFLREDHPLHGCKAYGYVRDLVEIEGFCNGFQQQAPEVTLTVLRFGQIVGPKADTPLTRFLREEEAFVLFGFDPMMQVIHEDDVVEAFIHSLNHDTPGAFNVAATKPLPLWKLMALAGKLPAPLIHILAYASVSMLGPRYAPIDLDYLRYPCVGDLKRMQTELGFTPQYTAEESLREFASQQRLRQYMPDSFTRAFEEERLRDILERRQRVRERTKARAVKTKQPARRTRRVRNQLPITLLDSQEEKVNHG